MHPVLFKIGQFQFYTHGVLAVFGIIAASTVIFSLAGARKLSREYLFDNIIYSVLFGIIGARLTYFFLYRDQFAKWRDVFFVWQGGLVSYGGFIAGALALLAILRLQKAPVLTWLDLFAVALPLGIFFGRMGDIFAGEYFGVVNPASLAFAGRIPVTLYEGIWDLILFGSLFFFYKKSSMKANNGIYLSLSVGLYSGGRFIIDFWRDDSNLVWNLSAGQITSLILFILSLLFFILQVTVVSRKKGKL